MVSKMGVGGDELGVAVGLGTGVDVLQPLEDHVVAALDGDVQRPAGRAGRRRVLGREVVATVHAVPVDGYDDDGGLGVSGRSVHGGDLERLLEGVGDDAVNRADADADGRDGPPGGASFDGLQDAFAVAQLVHGYIDRMRK